MPCTWRQKTGRDRPDRLFAPKFALAYRNFPMATAVSPMRHEKPHSLSYQLRMRHMLPSMTLVWSVAKIDECGSWLKSIETSFSSVTPSTPCKGPAAAALTASLISSTQVSRDASNYRTTPETFGVGTRNATPSSLPASSGSTRPTALAAPVDVGIMLAAAARARYRSLCSVSNVGWSPV